MQTSRFANVSRFEKWQTPISISRWSPSWYFGKSFLVLAPPGELVIASKRGAITKDDYHDLYTHNVLDKLDVNEVWKNLHDITDNPVLLCYEDLSIPGEWCHRRIVADWFTSAGFEVPEWTPAMRNRSTLSF